MLLLELFQSLDYEITFFHNTKDNVYYDLNGMGIQTQSITLNDDHFDTLITDLKPQVVLYDQLCRNSLVGACVLVFQRHYFGY